MQYLRIKPAVTAIAVAISVVVGAALVGIPTAGANATVNAVASPTAASVAATVANATTNAQQAAGVALTGDPANTPAVVTAPTGDVTATAPNGTSIGISMPTTPSAQTQVNSAMVLGSASPSQATAVINPTTGGVQVSQDLLGPSAPTSYSYKLSLPTGTKPVAESNGTIALTSAKGNTALDATNTIGFILPAWATDANGKSVPTSYSISGKTITQTVNTSGVTAWPVVADPTLSFGWVIYVHWFHREVGSVLVQAFISGVAAAGAAACTAISLGWLAAICLGIFAFVGTYVVGLFNTAYARGGGIVWEFLYTGNYVGYQYVGDNWS